MRSLTKIWPAKQIAGSNELEAPFPKEWTPCFEVMTTHWIGQRNNPINEDHAMAVDVDLMANCGLMSFEVGVNNPDRNCSKSAVSGDGVRLLDCPNSPKTVPPNDIYVLASDGLIALVRSQNSTRQGLSQAQVDQLDVDWRAQRKTDAQPLIDKLLSLPASAWLRDQQSQMANFAAEVFAMDNLGSDVDF